MLCGSNMSMVITSPFSKGDINRGHATLPGAGA